MNADTSTVLLSALEMALAEQTGKLFAVLIAASEADEDPAFERFALGLSKAIHRYEVARQMVELGPEEGTA